jgi:hypothetical protein
VGKVLIMTKFLLTSSFRGGVIMGVFDFLKKEKGPVASDKDLEIPPAPPIKEALPSFSKEDVRAIKEAIERPRKAAEPAKAISKIEKEAISAQKKLLSAREHLELTKPIFIDVKIYKEVIDEIALVQNTLKETQDSLERVGEFKEDEDKEFKRWLNIVQDAQKKLIYVDKTLFG